jgi:hypothetical protein
MQNEELTQAILALLNQGIAITIEPQLSPFGYLYAEITFTPPPSDQTAKQQIDAFTHGKRITLPGSTVIDLVYHPEHLHKAIKDAIILYQIDSTPRTPT